nr:ImmA/IrrE family metallo-endopeptidase [Clavibacter sp. VKM Ac-2872]
MESRGLTWESLADALELSDPQLRRLINGELTITSSLANKLAGALGSTAHFWESRESNYRESMSLLAADQLAQDSPMEYMVQKGWIEGTTEWAARARSLLAFYGVNTTDEWVRTWSSRLKEANFRTSPTFESHDLSVSAWLRCAEIKANQLNLSAWSPSGVRAVLPPLRRLSLLSNPQKFVPQAQALLASAGVALVILPATPENRLSGAAFVAHDQRRVIGLTGRHLSEDHFWFTLFHEIGHLLLHGDAGDFLDTMDPADADSLVEHEANEHARSILIPSGLGTLSEGRLTTRRVVAFAASQGISPGLVVGQLHHAKIIRYNQMQYLIRRYRWDGAMLKI